jgi:hypothetical protein
MKVIVVEGDSPEEIDLKVKEQGLDGPDVLVVGKVLTKHESKAVAIDMDDRPGIRPA